MRDGGRSQLLVISAHDRTGYGPHRDALSLREARNGTKVVKYTTKVPAGFKGPP